MHRRDERPGRARGRRAALLGLLAALLSLPSGAHAAYPGVDGRIAFERGGDIWVIEADGTGLVNVTSNLATDKTPAWSPDGTRLAFSTNRYGTGQDIAVREPDGTIVQLTSDAGDDQFPTWSPDGTRIAFESTRAGFSEIWTMDADGTDETVLVPGVSGQSRVRPVWSPDGAWIAYDANVSTEQVLAKVEPDGTDDTKLVRSSIAGISPVEADWSPDADRLVFRVTGEAGDLWTVEADGTSLTQLTSGTPYDRAPAYSPSGTKLLWSRSSSLSTISFPDIVVGTATAGSPTNLTSGGNADTEASWQPAAATPPIVTLTAPMDGSRTMDTTPNLTGIAGTATGDDDTVTVRVYSGSSASGGAIQTHSPARDPTTGAFSVPADVLAEGTYTARAEQSDDQGASGFSAAVTFHVDLTPPVPTIASPTEDETLDDDSPWIEGSAGDGAGDAESVRIRVYAGTAATGTPVADRTTSTTDDTFREWVGPLPDGEYTAVVRQFDSAGNQGDSAERHFEIAAPDLTGRIAFHSWYRSENDDIWTVRPDGTHLLNVTQHDASDLSPAWSPDGTRLAFSTDRWGDYEIAVREPDGTIARLTAAAGSDGSPAFSPDGTKIAFETWRSGASEIWLMDADGTDQQLLISGISGQGRNWPAWSPDGQWIAYATNESIDQALYKIRPDGTDKTTLARRSVDGVTPAQPQWSPDGLSVRFWSTAFSADGKQGDMWTANADGSGITRLPAVPEYERGPIHAPGGEQLVFSSHGPGVSIVFSDLWVMDVDGSGRRRLTTAELGDDQPAWQPLRDEPEVELTAPRDGSRVGDATPLVTGVGGRDPGDAGQVTVKLYEGSGRATQTQDHEAAVDPATGAFERELDTLAPGPYTVVAEQSDTAEPPNVGTSTAREFVVDLTDPVVTVTAPAQDATLTDRSPWIEGTAGQATGDAEDVRIRVYAGTTPAGTPVDDKVTQRAGDGTWRDWVGPLDPGAYVALVEQEDTAGNVGEVVRRFEVDPPPETGRVAFHSSIRDGNDEVYAIRVDGTGLQNLTQNAASDMHPAWSPDGTRLLFSTDRYGGDRDVAVREPDGSVTRLTTEAGHDDRPAWSPDGQRIAFESTRAGWSEIWVMGADGTDQTLLVPGASGQAREAPAWSPDGLWIAYTTLEGGDAVLYKVRPNGADTTPLASDDGDGLTPADPEWSPDGQHVRFWATSFSDDDKEGDIWSAAADGGGVERITSDPAFERMPAHAPDGGRLVFAAPRPFISLVFGDLWVSDADGSGRRLLTSAFAGDDQPAWQPVGGVPAPVVLAPDADEAVDEAGPVVSGTAGIAAGDAPTVTVRVHQGTKRTGAVVQEHAVAVGETGSWEAVLTALGEGLYTVEALQNDDQGNTGRSDPRTFRVDLTDPSIDITTPADGASFVHGSAVLAAYTCDDDGSGVAACDGPVSDGAAIDTETPGAKSFAVTATDAAGNQVTQTVGYTVTNAAPEIAFDAPATSTPPEGAEVQYTYTPSDDDGDAVAVTEESCGTGGTLVDTAAENDFSCLFPDGPASSTVSVTAEDDFDTTTETLDVSVQNAVPQAAFSGPSSGTTGDSLAFDGAASTDPGNDALTYAWDFDFGGSFVQMASGASASHAFAVAGAQVVGLRVTDEDGAQSAVTTRSVTISDPPPPDEGDDAGAGGTPPPPAPVPEPLPPPPPPPGPGPGPPSDDEGPLMGVRLPKPPSLPLLLGRGLRYSATCSEACTVRGALFLATGSTRAVAARAVLVGRGTARLVRAGRATVVVRVTKKGRRVLRLRRRQRRVVLRLRTVAVDASGNRTTRTRRVTVRPRPRRR